MKSKELLMQADKVYGSPEYASSIELYKEAANQAEADGATSEQIEALSQVARALSRNHQLEEGRMWLARAEAVASPEFPLGWSRYLGVRGVFERESGDGTKATLTFKEMYEYCQKHDLHSRAIDAAHHVGIAGGQEEKVEWGLKAIKEAQAGEITHWLGPLWNNLGNAYDELERYEEALEAFLKARDAHNAAGNLNTHIGDWAVAKAYRKVGNVELARENLNKGQALVDQCFKDDPNAGSREWRGWYAWERGQLLVLEGDSDAGAGELRKGYDDLIEAGIRTWGPYFENQAKEMLAQVEKLEVKK